ncbi:hypothetical protein lerEdw1_003592 [Lerista edwardsae]|nr:hypothetical protein lerEdw1_003592 [Lerista edwardsae]
MGEGGRGLGCRLLFNLGVSVVLLRSLLPIVDGRLDIPPGYASYEVFIPRRLVFENGSQATQGQLSYVFKAEGKNYIVRLHRKDIPLKEFPVFIYAGDKLRKAYHGIQEGCYYRGSVEGAAESFVTLSTCSGFRGLLQVENLMYNIDPMEGSSTFQHLIYRAEATNSDLCWPSAKEVSESVAAAIGEEATPRPPEGAKFLELFIQVDAGLYRHYSSDPLTAAQNVARLVQMVDDTFAPLGLRILLVGLGIWRERNKIFISNYVSDIVPAFNKWRLWEVVPRLRHDASLLLAFRRRTPAVVTHSFFGGVCDVNKGVAFVSAMGMPLQRLSTVVAHELARVIGIPVAHPEAGSCPPKRNCVVASRGEKPGFTNCSVKRYFDVVLLGKGRCLNNFPVDRRPTLPHCGNGIVEDGEECDCGNNPRCKRSRCCLQDCRAAPGAVCNLEDCCWACKIAPQGTLCRKRASECDLPEYCNGASLACPADVLVQDGTPCADDGYCYAGRCASHTLQCRKIFGAGSRGAPLPCFRAVNSQGDRFGHCDGKAGRFRRCPPGDLLCGRVQCVNVGTLPELKDQVTVIQTPTEDALCWGLEFHSGQPLVDVGAVEEGAKCGQRKICVNRFCVRVADLAKTNQTCDPVVDCSGRGVCNANQHCHCDDGWAPPNCLLPGFGGSVDSGSALPAHTSSRSPPAIGILVAATLGIVGLFRTL